MHQSLAASPQALLLQSERLTRIWNDFSLFSPADQQVPPRQLQLGIVEEEVDHQRALPKEVELV